MKKESIKDFNFDYFIGNFNPSLLKTNEVEIAFRSYKKYTIIHPFFRKKDQEIVLITKGCIEYENNLYKKGDILNWAPNEKIYGFIKENTDVLIIRSPGTKSDWFQYFDNYFDFDLFYGKCYSDLSKVYEQKHHFPVLSHIDSSEVSVVIQGKVDRYTNFTIESIKRHLPNAEIILSVWEGDDVSSLFYDKIVFNNDPGVAYINRDNKPNNCNRQIVSSRNGCNLVERRYILKLRTDMVLFSNKFLSFYNPKEKSIIPALKSRILIGQIYSRDFLSFSANKKDSLKTPFHPSDWFFFGNSDDIKCFFNNVKLMDSKYLAKFCDYSDNILKEKNNGRHAPLAPEQHMLVSFLNNYYEINYRDFFDINRTVLKQSEKYMQMFKILNLFQSGICNIKYLNVCFENSGLNYNIRGLCPFCKE